MTGPTQPTTIDQKIAGFTRAAHRMYCDGELKNSTGAMIADCYQMNGDDESSWASKVRDRSLSSLGRSRARK